jgi:hypothetical protein
MNEAKLLLVQVMQATIAYPIILRKRSISPKNYYSFKAIQTKNYMYINASKKTTKY